MFVFILGLKNVILFVLIQNFKYIFLNSYLNIFYFRDGILRNFAGYKNNQRYLRFSKRGILAEDGHTKPFYVKEGQEESITGH